MINFGIEGKGLGAFLVILNLVILALAGWLAYAGLRKQKSLDVLKDLQVGEPFVTKL
jgi:hypothetical protein